MKLGLVLEGGGMRGIYTCGILDVMIEKGFEPDVLCGTSAGALFGINLPSKQKGRAYRYNYKHCVDPNYVSLRSLIKTGNMVNVDFAYNRIPNELAPFDEETYEKSKTKVFATVTNVRTGKAEYKLIENCYEQIDWLRASGSLPIALESTAKSTSTADWWITFRWIRRLKKAATRSSWFSPAP